MGDEEEAGYDELEATGGFFAAQKRRKHHARVRRTCVLNTTIDFEHEFLGIDFKDRVVTWVHQRAAGPLVFGRAERGQVHVVLA